MKIFLLTLGCFFLSGCFNDSYRLRQISSGSNEFNPVLSGNGKKLAFIMENNGYKKIIIKDIANGRLLPVRYLSRHEPYSSPSLSWNGRYLALITQNEGRRMAFIEDLISGRVYRLPLRLQVLPESISLSPDASKAVVEFNNNGKNFLRFLDLSDKLKPDLLNKSLSNEVN